MKGSSSSPSLRSDASTTQYVPPSFVSRLANENPPKSRTTFAQMWNSFLSPFENRWCRLIVYMWTNAVSTLIYGGWAPLSAILFKSGAYDWQCDDTWWSDNEEPCTRQYNSVQALYTTALFGLCVASLIAGVVYDKLGPRITGAIGQIMFSLGWIMLAFSSKSLQLYIPAFLLISSSVNFTGFACLVLCDLFPSRPGLLLSMLNAVQSIATAIPLAFQYVMNGNANISLRQILIGYLLVILVPSGVLLFFCLPYFKGMALKSGSEDFADIRELGGLERSVNSEVIEKKLSGGEGELVEKMKSADAIGGEMQSQNEMPYLSVNIIQADVEEENNSVNLVDSDLDSECPTGQNLAAKRVSMQSLRVNELLDLDIGAMNKRGSMRSIADSFLAVPENSFILLGEAQRSMISAVGFQSGFRQLKREVTTSEFLLFTLFYTFILLAVGYYPTTVQKRNGQTISTFLGIMTAFQMIPAMLLGVIVDYTKTLPISIALSASTFLIFVFAFIGTQGLQYATIILYVFVLSFIYTVKLTYVQEIFSAANYGTLVGCMATTSGLVLPLNIGIQFAPYKAAFTCYLVTVGLTIPLLFFLLMRQRRGINYKQFFRSQQ